jgi:3-hydroxy-3-methylglutaryl CoA synthase/uncharacterized OB-fold protein
MTTGILSFGAYIPRRRLSRAAIYATNAWFAPGLKGLSKGERAIADWDEDPITLAVEAARDALTGVDRATIAETILASTTLPFADRQNAGIVKEALTLSDNSGTMDVSGSLRAGTTALLHALGSSDGRARLCIAADLRLSRPASEAELLNGDSSAALVVGQGPVVARHCGSHTVSVDFVDHYRAAGSDYDYGWESRWIRDEGYHGVLVDALKGGLTALGTQAAEIDRVIIPVVMRGAAASVAKKAGFREGAVADILLEQVGDGGVSHPLLLLVAALEAAKPGDKILLVGFGQGVDMILLEATDALLDLPARRGVAGSIARRAPDSNYARWLFHRGQLDLERGMRAESDLKQPATALWRERKGVMGLVGGRCTRTGTVQFPKTDISVNPNDHARFTQEDYPLADRRAKIVTYTADSLTYTPAPPLYYGLIDFEGGGRMKVEFADVEEGDVEVGRELEMVFRIHAVDERRNFKRYFWKAAPVATEA